MSCCCYKWFKTEVDDLKKDLLDNEVVSESIDRGVDSNNSIGTQTEYHEDDNNSETATLFDGTDTDEEDDTMDNLITKVDSDEGQMETMNNSLHSDAETEVRFIM